MRGPRRRTIAVAAGCIAAVLCAAVWAAVEVRPGGKRFESDGVTLYYTDRGGEGEPVILLHGFGLNARTGWEIRVVPYVLQDRFRVIALDQRGHGRSEKPHEPEAYGAKMAEDVVRLMDHLGIARAHVAGYSMGAFVTLKLATLHPERLITAAVCGAGFERAEGDKLRVITELKTSVERGEGFGPLARALEPGGKDPGRLKVAALNFYLRWANDEQALAAVAGGFAGLAVTEDRVRACRVPMISIVGERDPLRPGVEALHALVPGHELVVVPGRNHFTTMPAKAFRSALFDFLARHPAPPA